MVARDGIEPPTPAFSGRLPDRVAALRYSRIVRDPPILQTNVLEECATLPKASSESISGLEA